MTTEQSPYNYAPFDYAFPNPDGALQNGLTKREYFAAQAMACFSQEVIVGIVSQLGLEKNTDGVSRARSLLAVIQADMLLEALNKPTS